MVPLVEFYEAFASNLRSSPEKEEEGPISLGESKKLGFAEEIGVSNIDNLMSMRN